MKINKQTLLSALETVKPGLASKEMIQQATSFCFKDGRVMTYNDEVSISCPVEGLEFEGAVSATELFSFLQKLKTDEIEIEVEETQLIFRSGKVKAGIIFQQEILIPVEEVGAIEKWKKLPDNFIEGLNFTMGSCSRNMAQPILTCVHVNKSKLESSDSYRIAHFEMSSPVTIKPFLLPANTCVKVIKLNPSEIASGEGWVHFKTKETIMSCRIFDEQFPDTNPHINFKGVDIQFPSTLIESLDLAGVFAKRDTILDESISIEIEGGVLKVRAASESGWLEQKSRIKMEGASFKFNITPYLFKDILSKTTIGEISENKILFKGENWKYLTLLR